MKLRSLLYEGLSPILFHYTRLNSLVDILKTNTFRLSVAFGTREDNKINAGKLYYLSTSRIKFGGYARSEFYERTPSVILVLDGSALSHNYGGVSADYWGKWFKDAALQSGDLDRFLKNTENEDRVISNKDVIPNAKKFILEIHIFIPSQEHLTGRYVAELKTIHSLFKPIYYYRDANAFKLLNKTKASNTFEVPKLKKEKGEKSLPFRMNQMLSTTAFMELFNSKSLSGLSDDASSMKWSLHRGNVDDIIRQVESEIHNNKNRNDTRDKIRQFGQLMRKAKVHSISDLVKQLATRIQSEVK